MRSLSKAASAAPSGGDDYLANAGVAAFFVAREHEAYYRSLKSVDERRAFQERLSAVLEEFLALADEPTLRILDGIIRRTRQVAGGAADGSFIARARARENVGIDLLGVEENVGLDDLRRAYRSAALRLHPDRGGSNDAMAAVNRAYEVLHALLVEELEEEPAGSEEVWSGPRTGADYVYTATRLLFDVVLDEWALDRAMIILERVTGDLLSTTTFDSSNELIGFIPSSSKLAQWLAATGRQEDAARALAIAQAGLVCAQKRGLLYDGIVAQAGEVVAGTRKPRFVLNHLRQVENAFRLGAINEKRYAENRLRVEHKADQGEEERSERERVLASTTFMRSLPVDSAATSVPKMTERLVPQPGYYEVRIESLTLEQQSEYGASFVSPCRLELVEKYAFVRLSSLLRSAIYHPDVIDGTVLADEARKVAVLQPKSAWCAVPIARILDYFGKLTGRDRVAYANDLRRLLEPDPQPITVGEGEFQITFTIGFMNPSELGGRFLESAEAAGKRWTDGR
jgi:hypothetical protein